MSVSAVLQRLDRSTLKGRFSSFYVLGLLVPSIPWFIFGGNALAWVAITLASACTIFFLIRLTMTHARWLDRAHQDKPLFDQEGCQILEDNNG